jgi:hypothetical protein
VLAACLLVRSDALPPPAAHVPGRLGALPRLTIWAWERREDLRNLKPRAVAVAYLDQTLTLGLNVHAQPRRDAVVFPASAVRIPVVRLEAPRTAVLDQENRSAAVGAILRSAREPGIAALQIDFDATLSQRGFYRALLQDVRRQMPANLPLSITALVSWCSWDSWLDGLPIDEAVPMFFRMEPDHRRAPPSADDFRIRARVCQSSVGLSTTEPWPMNLEPGGLAGRRVYLFSDAGWRGDPPAALPDPPRALWRITMARRVP